MKDYELTCVHFSPSGTTKKIATLFSIATLDLNKEINLLTSKIDEDIIFNENDLVVVAMPVYCGRIPELVIDSLKKLKSNNAIAVPIVVFGNRDYDDALLELADILEEQGFNIMSAAAFVAQHSLFPTVAKNRPDDSDNQKINDFAELTIDNIEKFEKDGKKLELNIKGNRPYKKFKPVPLYPTGNNKCTNCGLCSKICPVDAIDKYTPKKTDISKCISCTACIKVCPTNARGLWGIIPKTAEKGFAIKCAKRVEPEWFC